jgi:hypothetical protein
MSMISDGFKIGSVAIAKKYTMTKAEMGALGDGTGYPDVFPIWCTDDDSLYIFYRTVDGVAKIASASNIGTSATVPVLYPTINTSTYTISWSVKSLTDAVPDPVVLKSAPGDSAYDVWKAQGNTGTEQDFLNSIFNPSLLTDTSVATLKTKLGLDTLETELADINTLLAKINA